VKVAQVMSKDVKIINPDQTLRDAALMMSKEDIGAIPVAEHDHLIGMVTDRDIAVRGVAEGKGPEAKIREVMTRTIKYCFEDEELDHVSKNMADVQMRRLPVMNRQKRLVGIITLGDLATKRARSQAERALHGISQPTH